MSARGSISSVWSRSSLISMRLRKLRTTARRLTVMDYPPLAAAAAAHLQRALFFSPAPWDLARVGAALRAPSQPFSLPPADLCCASPIAMTMAFLLLLAQSLSGRRG